MTFHEMIPFMPETCMLLPKAKGVSNHHQLVLGISHFLLVLFFRRCHNLAITLTWNDDVPPSNPLILDDSMVKEWFYYALINACKKERERSNKKCTSAENEIFQMHFLWDFLGVCRRTSFFSPLQMVLQMKHLYCMQAFQASCLDKLQKQRM